MYLLDGLDVTTPDADLAVFEAVIGEAAVVGLGESRHCGGGYLEAKARLVRWLVETQGFRLVTIESPWVRARPATQFVAHGEGDAKAAMNSFFLAFHDRETEAMLAWLAGWNVAHPDDPVRFHGFDVQDSLPELLGVLRDAGASEPQLAACAAGPCTFDSDDPWVRLAVRGVATRRALDAARVDGRGAYSEVRDLGMADTLLAIRGIVAPDPGRSSSPTTATSPSGGAPSAGPTPASTSRPGWETTMSRSASWPGRSTPRARATRCRTGGATSSARSAGSRSPRPRSSISVLPPGSARSGRWPETASSRATSTTRSCGSTTRARRRTTGGPARRPRRR